MLMPEEWGGGQSATVQYVHIYYQMNQTANIYLVCFIHHSIVYTLSKNTNF